MASFGRSSTRRVVVGVAGLVFFGILGAGCSASSGSSPQAGSAAMFTPTVASTLGSELTSPTVSVRDKAVIPQLRAQLGTQPLIPAGTSVHIDAATFHDVGSETATVQATTTGAYPGRWTLDLVDDDGIWQLLNTDPAS